VAVDEYPSEEIKEEERGGGNVFLIIRFCYFTYFLFIFSFRVIREVLEDGVIEVELLKEDYFDRCSEEQLALGNIDTQLLSMFFLSPNW